MKAFDKVRRDLLFDILQDKNIPNLLLQNIIEIYTDSKISVKINNCISERKLVNNGVRQGCPLSPTLFNIYINEIILKWNQIYTSGIKITSALTLNTLLYADDQVIISNSEDNLQRGLYTLNKILKDFGMEISAQKSKVMAFLGQDPVRSKIIHNNQCLEQVQNFNYLGCEISYQNEKDVNKKITKFTQILGIINNTLKAKLVQKSTRIKIYNTLALPSLLYGSEIWTLKKKDMNRIKATEMKFFRRTAGYTLLDRKRNEEILEQLEVESVEEKISRYKFNWLDHVRRMENSRIPKIMMQYKPRGHRRPGRPLRRLLDGAETGLQRPNS